MTETTATVTASQPKTRVGLFCRHSDVAAFTTARDEINASIQAGLISKDNPIAKWINNPVTVDAMTNLVPGDTASEEELIGFDSFGENAEKVQTMLNRKCVEEYVNRQTVAALVCSVTIPDWRNLEEDVKESKKTAALAWVDANVSDEGKSRIFESKKGRGGGVRLIAKL